jgi:uncharacterized membrane protein YdfJ with MMPL/SSD domain
VVASAERARRRDDRRRLLVRLLTAHLSFFREFGPGLASCALIVTAVAVTLVPALLASSARACFRRRGPCGPRRVGGRARAGRTPTSAALRRPAA